MKKVVIKSSTDKTKLDGLLEHVAGEKIFKASKLKGRIKLTESPLEIQKKMRDEWP